MKRLSIAESLREGIAEEMRRDPSVFCLGEDIAVPGGWGGAFTVTLGLEEEFPDRMLNTPIAELGFFGAAVGAAIMGMRPIVDVQYGDFLFLAMDQIVNNAAKLRYMSGGTIKVPVVMRAPIGATGRGSQHAQSMERYFTGVPGIKVVAVSNAYDAKGVLKIGRARRQPGADLRAQAALRLEGRAHRARRRRRDQRHSRRRLHRPARPSRGPPRGQGRDDPRLAVDGSLRRAGRREARGGRDRRRGDRRPQPFADRLRNDRRIGAENGAGRHRRRRAEDRRGRAPRSPRGSWNGSAKACWRRLCAWRRPTCRCRSRRCSKTPIGPTATGSSRPPSDREPLTDGVVRARHRILTGRPW